MAAVRTFVIAFLVAGVVAFGLSLLNVYALRHGGQPMPHGDITMIATFVAGLALFMAYQRRGNRDAARASLADERAAKAFAPRPERAVLYVFRDAFFAKLVGFEFERDGTLVGQTRGKTFYRLDLNPGVHVFASVNPQDGSRQEIRLNLPSASLTFLEHEIAFAAKGLNHALRVVDDVAGRRRVLRCKMLVPMHLN